MLLSVESVSKSFGGVRAVQSVSLTVAQGEIVGVIGSNGAGKSTLFNLIAGYHRPDSGVIRFDGQIISKCRADVIASSGLVKTFQLVKPFASMSLRENVMVGLLRRGMSVDEAHGEAEPLLKSVGLETVKDAMPSELPYAMRRRLEIARALGASPKLLLLDEALAGLTQTELSEMIKTLREIRDRGVTLMMVEHVMDATMALCQRIVVLHQGRCIATGSPEHISKDAMVIDAYLGHQNA